MKKCNLLNLIKMFPLFLTMPAFSMDPEEHKLVIYETTTPGNITTAMIARRNNDPYEPLEFRMRVGDGAGSGAAPAVVTCQIGSDDESGATITCSDGTTEVVDCHLDSDAIPNKDTVDARALRHQQGKGAKTGQEIRVDTNFNDPFSAYVDPAQANSLISGVIRDLFPSRQDISVAISTENPFLRIRFEDLLVKIMAIKRKSKGIVVKKRARLIE